MKGRVEWPPNKYFFNRGLGSITAYRERDTALQPTQANTFYLHLTFILPILRKFRRHLQDRLSNHITTDARKRLFFPKK